MPDAVDPEYFETKARQCFRLAAGCHDPEVSAHLYELGAAFIAEALKAGADPHRLQRLQQSAGPTRASRRLPDSPQGR